MRGSVHEYFVSRASLWHRHANMLVPPDICSLFFFLCLFYSSEISSGAKDGNDDGIPFPVSAKCKFLFLLSLPKSSREKDPPRSPLFSAGFPGAFPPLAATNRPRASMNFSEGEKNRNMCRKRAKSIVHVSFLLRLLSKLNSTQSLDFWTEYTQDSCKLQFWNSFGCLFHLMSLIKLFLLAFNSLREAGMCIWQHKKQKLVIL